MTTIKYDVTRTTTASKEFTVKVFNNTTDEIESYVIIGADLKEAKKNLSKDMTFLKVVKEETTEDEKRGMSSDDFKLYAEDITGCTQTERLKYYITRTFFNGYGTVDMYNRKTREIETYNIYGRENDIVKLAKEQYSHLVFCSVVEYTKGTETLYGMNREQWERLSDIIE